MTKKFLDKLHDECIAYERAELKKLTNVEFLDDDVELVDQVCNAILSLRDKYELGNVDTRDCTDEINAIMPIIYKILAAHDLYDVKIS